MPFFVNSPKKITAIIPMIFKRIPTHCITSIVPFVKAKDKSVVIGEPKSKIEVATETLIAFNPL